MYQNLLNTIKSYLSVPWMGVLSDHLYQFSSTKDDYKLTPAKNLSRLKFLLLSREHYQETQKEYPVESRKELNKIIKLELSAYPESLSLYRIGEYKNKKRTVTFAKVNDKAMPYFEQISWLFCLPESWLIGDLYDSQLIQVDSKVTPYWLYSTEEKVHSYPIKGLFTSLSAFSAAVGINNEVSETKLSQHEVLELFRQKFLYFITKYFFGILIRKNIRHSFEIKKFITGVIASMFTLLIYYFGASLYLDKQLVTEQNKQKVLFNSAGELFELQKSMQASAETVTAVEKVLSAPHVSLDVWRTLLPLYQNKELQFKNISILADNTITIMAEAPKATMILEQLSKQSNVIDAYFYADVSQIKGRDRFTIRYNLRLTKDQGNNNG